MCLTFAVTSIVGCECWVSGKTLLFRIEVLIWFFFFFICHCQGPVEWQWLLVPRPFINLVDYDVPEWAPIQHNWSSTAETRSWWRSKSCIVSQYVFAFTAWLFLVYQACMWGETGERVTQMICFLTPLVSQSMHPILKPQFGHELLLLVRWSWLILLVLSNSARILFVLCLFLSSWEAVEPSICQQPWPCSSSHRVFPLSSQPSRHWCCTGQ